ncbi:STAS domain-containing protein [Actinokineospora enzanensis]|uniref:STAS domain-containing protein n=1 Tax=Actinokineospora enzanensis TaxID=155975 RepID=UPI0003772CA8|nr:STAS domain-containing protein [Actinokineospora enzanensis]
MALRFARSAAQQRRRDLWIGVERTARATTVTAAGRIDLATEAPWHDEVMQACTATDATAHVTIDLTRVTHLSWASTEVLRRAHRACIRRGRALTITAAGAVLTSLQLTRLHEEIVITAAPRPEHARRPVAASGWLTA